ncbi:Replication initiator protein [Staphylococcus aureus]|uniref:replication initiator protein A n=1 Tax=Staphylococcus aureus TaxID=1280 RepID=UPI000E024E28|nr:Replication initiator protein [Staphylococcus aureus]
MSKQFFTVEENYKERFYQLPKVFFTNPNYKDLSNDAKIAYAILRDRLQLSIKNNWIDTEGNIYFIYTVADLEVILNCGNKKITKIKKELENVDLLIQKRQGLNKPNLLYLLKPAITKNDIYEIDKAENEVEALTRQGSVKRTRSRNVKRTRLEMSKGHGLEMSKGHTNDTDFIDTDFIDTESNDMNNMNDTNQHSNHSNHFSNIHDKESLKYIELQELPELIKSYINNFSYEEVKSIKSVILKAKKSFNNKYDTFYMLEDIDEELLLVLKTI